MKKGRKIPRKDDKLIKKLNEKYAGDNVVPYMGNASLPSNRSKFEYDPERVKVFERCQENILYFAQHFFFIVNLDVGKHTIDLHPFQRDALRTFRDHRKSIMCCSRQVGKSTVITIYALWLCLFHEYQKVVIVANKEKTAQELLRRIQLAYSEIPAWLKSGVEKWGKQGVEFSNGCDINISATSSDAVRGMAVSALLIDEMAFIDSSIMDAFWSAVYPTISSSKNAKVLIASTPNGVGNLFHSLWTKAHEPNSDWGHIRITWKDIPDRDEEWARNERLAMGDDIFEQEYECKFLESGESFIPEDLYKELEKECRSAKLVLDDDNYKIYEKPDPQNRTYVAGIDIGEGVGANASTICILDITELTNIEQVATYHCNDMGPYEFAKKTNEVLSHWGKPPVAVERNNTGGGVVITTLDKEYNYPRLIQFATKQGTINYDGMKGVTSSTNTKHHGVMNMFYFVKTYRRVVLHDLNYLKELNTFVRHANNKWSKRKGDNIFDDRVDALIWALIGIHEMVVGQFYHVTIWDDNKKPLHVQPMYENEQKSNADYLFGTHENNYGIDSLVMPAAFTDDPEIARMNEAGWLLPEQAGNWSSYEPAENYFGRT